MVIIDSFTDVARVITFCVSLYCVGLLIHRYRTRHMLWNKKTLDYWYALFMWSVSGCVFTVQGIVLDRPLTPATVCLIAAVLVTGKGLHQSGPWGDGSRG